MLPFRWLIDAYEPELNAWVKVPAEVCRQMKTTQTIDVRYAPANTFNNAPVYAPPRPAGRLLIMGISARHQ